MHFERQESDLPGIMQQIISRAREKCKQSQLLVMYSTQAKILLTEKKAITSYNKCKSYAFMIK